MSDEKKWPWEIAMPEAEAIVERLKPCCERIAIARNLGAAQRFSTHGLKSTNGQKKIINFFARTATKAKTEMEGYAHTN